MAKGAEEAAFIEDPLDGQEPVELESEEEEEPVQPITLKKSEKKSVKKEEKQINIRLSRKRLIIGLIVLALLALGLLIWRLRWYQPLLDRYNNASVSLKVKEGDTFVVAGASLQLNGATYTTDANGKVSIPRVPAGSYHLVVSKSGYLPAQEDLNLKRGDNGLQYITLTKTPEKVYTVSGFVKDWISAQPVSNVQVTLGSQTVSTDPSGEYKFEKVVPGDISLHFSKAGFLDKDVAQTVKDQDIATASLPLVPQGQVIFVSNRDGKRGIYTTNYDGSNQKRLLSAGNGEDFNPVIAPNNKQLVFSSTRDGVQDPYGSSLVKLYVVGSDGSNLRKVGDDVAASITPTWSPDGRYLFYTAYTSPKLDQTTHKIYDTQNNTLTDLGEDANGLVFSPDSSWAAYYVLGTADASTIDANGLVSTASPAATATTTPTPAASASASPLSSTGPVNIVVLKVYNLATGEHRIIRERQQYMSDLRFTSDSSAVSYEVIINSVRHRFQTVLASPNPETEVALPTQPAGVVYVPSPSGNSQAYIVERDGKEDLFISDRNGQNEQRLTTLGVLNNQAAPIWDPSGSYIVFAVRREGENAWYVVSTSVGDPQKVTDYYLDTP